ncbi:G protein-coupled receptor 158a isoform 2-T2 [Spinachia spinachia]
MAVFRLSLLLQVGFVIGSNPAHAEWSARGDGDAGARGEIRGAPEHPPGEAARGTQGRLPRAVAAFLHTGDSTALRHANCSRRYELASPRGGPPGTPHPSVSGVLDAVLHAANFLNVILRANRSKEPSLRRDIEWYRALVRSVLEGDATIHRAVVALSAEPAAAGGPSVLLQATRASGEIVLRDLSGAARRHLHNRTVETEWYHAVKEGRKPGVHKRPLSRDSGTPGHKAHVKWSAPYLECENGNLVPRWLVTLSAAFYGLKPNLAPEFRGVVRVDINLQDVDIDQCSGDGWFAGTHRCNLTTMECVPLRGHGFVLDKYSCRCRTGFYHPRPSGFTGTGRKGKAGDEGSSSDCLPCRQGCAYCRDETPCVAPEDGALRLALVSVQGLCVLLVFVAMVLVYHFRRNKSIRASGLVLLEAILCGALLLYFPVGILYFQPSVFRCILLRWVRLLGFATVYGTLTLKLYRVLKVFLSRTAQRIPYLTSWRVLRLLGIILLIVCWFLVAWTSAVCQNPDRKSALIGVGYTPDGLQFSMCLLDRWDYMMAVAEFLFLLWPVYLCYAVRTVPSAFHEPRYMAIAVHSELLLTAIFYTIRFTLAPELHPDWMLLLFFTHTHVTVTVTLGLLLIPKFLFAGTHMREDIASEAYEDELDMGRSGSYLNSSITSAWSEHSLDPEDIREELKRLYSQLEIYKRKKMLANNPHLQKKRSSKKGLGRSLMRRITEIPESVHRQCSREDKDAGEHGSNRNSICMLKKNPFDPTHQSKPAKEDTLKNKVFSLKKSHSSYDHVRDQSEESSSSATDKMEAAPAEGSLLDALMGKKLVKKQSGDNVSVPSESTESVPLVCKSASAHNLSADKKPMHPRASMLQKSLSVIASAKEKTLGLTGKAAGAEESSRRSQPKSKDARVNPEPENERQPKMIVSQSVEYKQTAALGRIPKQPVSSSQPSICSDPVKAKDLYDLSEVCPWEVEDLPTPSESKVQKHVSIAPKETTTVHGGGAKAGKPPKQKASDQSPSSGRVSKNSQRTTAVRADVCPWEDGGESQEDAAERKSSKSPKTQRPRSTTEGSKAQPVDVCPWDFEEPQTTAELARLTDATPAIRGPAPAEGKAQSIPSDPSKAEGSVPPPSSKAASPGSERTPSPSRAHQTKGAPSKKRDAAAARTVERSKDADDDRSRAKAKDKSKSSERHASQQKMAEVCPWDAEGHPEVPPVEKRRSANVAAATAKPADVCPWDFADTLDKKGTDSGSVANPKGGAAADAKKADVCPWDFDDGTSGKRA